MTFEDITEKMNLLEKRFAEIRRKTRKIDKRLKAILDFIETITTNENLKNEKKGF